MTSGRRLIGIGAAAGFAAWVYDYDFFLNAGGPATPMSRGILAATRLTDAGPLVIVFWPLAVMLAVGAGLGFIAKLVGDVYVRERVGRR